jgi:hypothetical protein
MRGTSQQAIIGLETEQMQTHRLAFGEHFVKQYGIVDVLFSLQTQLINCLFTKCS